MFLCTPISYKKILGCATNFSLQMRFFKETIGCEAPQPRIIKGFRILFFCIENIGIYIKIDLHNIFAAE